MENSVIVVIVAFLAGASHVEALTEVEFGMEMSVRAYDSICWYEKLKQFPQTDSKGFMRECFDRAENVKKQIKGDDDTRKKYFGEWMIQLAMKRLPSEYSQRCNSFLQNPSTSYPVDLKTVLNDGQSRPFPFQGFSYCLLSVLREKYGEKATEAVINEKTVKKKYWVAAILERDNEFRARHGSAPLQLDKELNGQAQVWADTMASKCQMYHSQNEDVGRRWKGESTGENLASGSGTVSMEDAAYVASNGWYEEIKDYPFPQGHVKDDGLFMKIGHFTQTVWRSTQFVGYGFSYNPKCQSGKWFVAARYALPGNMDGQFQENVLPPKF